jgi:hypothetical protein
MAQINNRCGLLLATLCSNLAPMPNRGIIRYTGLHYGDAMDLKDEHGKGDTLELVPRKTTTYQQQGMCAK